MERFFGIDLRGLGAMRCILGGILLYDLSVRAGSSGLFLTDSGVLPVEAALSQSPLSWVPSLHLLSGSWGFQAALLAVHAAAALALLIGWRTRVATVLCWYLTLSLHFRNELVLNGGDYLLRWILFWSMFLPLGSRFSWTDFLAKKRGESTPSGSVANIATAGFLFTLCVMYWGSAMNKDPDLWLLHPSGLYYSLHLDPFTSPLGVHLREASVVLSVLTVLVYIVEWVAPLFIVSGRARLRAAGVTALLLLHLGIAVFMQVGLFWLVAVAALTALLPSEVWDKVTTEGRGNPVSSALPAAVQVGLGCILLFVPYLNLSLFRPETLPVPVPLYTVYRTLGLHYGWNMFARVNENLDGWYVMEADLADGRTVDLLTGKEVAWAKPGVYEIYPNQRWRRYLADLYRPGGNEFLRPFALCLAREWNSGGAPAVKQIRVHYMAEPTPDKPGSVEIEDRLLLDFSMEESE